MRVLAMLEHEEITGTEEISLVTLTQGILYLRHVYTNISEMVDLSAG